MLDARVYRAAFLPLLLALFVAAFSLERRPPPAVTPLAADAFNAAGAFASLEELGTAFPRRGPGSGDDAGLADRVARSFASNGFEVARRTRSGRPAGEPQNLETVVGVRPGVSSRSIVVMADRAALGSPGLAELSGTAAMLELARIFRAAAATRAPGAAGETRAVGRDLRRTLVLVSSSGAGLGGGEPAARAIEEVAGPREAIDAVLVLGDLAGTRVVKPWVVPWSNGGAEAPLGLRRTVESAVRSEVGSQPGGARATGQWVRRAIPLTVSAQGEPAAAGLPAVLLQVSGERGPAANARVSLRRLGAFGRAALRTVSAIDEIGAPEPGSARPAPADGGPPAFAAGASGLVTVRRVLPGWAVRMLVGAALLPALLAALDGFFRVRRRRVAMRGWLGWAVLGALPFVLAYAWLRLVALVGGIRAPAAPVLPGAAPLEGGEITALASTALVLGLGWLAVRRARPLLRPHGDASAGGGAAAIGLLVGGVAAVAWVLNPYAAMLLVPAAHGWLLAAAPGTRLRGGLGVAALGLGLVPLLLVALHYAVALDLGPLEEAWLAVLLLAGGHVSVPAALAGALVLGCLTATASVLAARRRVTRAAPEEAGPRTRGPVSYAGPGSLGGTESALRR